MRALTLPFLALSSLLVAAACDDMNKPAYVPKSEPRKGCFSDVECPGAKCVKSANAVQGVCTEPVDGGAPQADPNAPPTTPDGPPPPKPQPGDVQI